MLIPDLVRSERINCVYKKGLSLSNELTTSCGFKQMETCSDVIFNITINYYTY